MATDVQPASAPTMALTAREERDAAISKSLRRERAIKEQKLGAQRRMGGFQEEETSIFEANVKEARQLYEQQLTEQRLVDDRQREAAIDLLAAEARKRELISMVHKIAAIKNHVTQQDQARERELDFRAQQKQKREAFEKRTKTIEAGQITERKDLAITQDRVARNLKMIHSLEMRSMSENDRKARSREYELQYQQLKMRQQKESEQLRELQLIKVRHLSEQMEIELLSATEIEDMIGEQRLRENSLEAEQVLERAAEANKLDQQQAQLKALQLKEDQKLAKGHLLQAQNRQRRLLERNQRYYARQRERAIMDETGNMMAEVGLGVIGAGEGSAAGTSERDTSEAYELQSSHAGTSEVDRSELMGEEAGEHEMTEAEIQELVQQGAGKSEADRRRKQRTTNDAAAELNEALAKGVERLKNLEIHHRKNLDAVRAQHKDQREQKIREQKRKQSQLLKDQEDEVQTIRSEQAADMEELFEMIRQAQELHAEQEAHRAKFAKPETAVSIPGNLMPKYFSDAIKSATIPDPVSYDHAVVVRTSVAGFRQIDPKQGMILLQRMYAAFDKVIAQFEGIFKIESVVDLFVLCSGLTEPTTEKKTEEEKINDANLAVQCALELTKCAAELDVADLADLGLPNNAVKLKIGIQNGPVKAGMVGGRAPQFRVLGETVDRALKLCAAAEPSGTLVAKEIRDMLGDKFKFEQIETGGNVFWLKE